MIWIWIGFLCFVLLMLAMDLGVFHRHSHIISVKEAVGWTIFWIILGVSFTVFVYYGYENHWMGMGAKPDAVDGLVNDGMKASVKYLTGYVLEKSLSVDNIFVIAMLFNFFAVPRIYQHRVLFWGIMGALVLRGAMILVGATLIAKFHWILYLFGVFLIITGLKMLVAKSGHTDPNHNIVVRTVRRIWPVTSRFHGEHFLVRAGSTASHESETPGGVLLADEIVERTRPGTLMFTPLALALVVVETTDVVFAVDSIPAIFAITADPFLVFTSNVFAILGLRSIYFALDGMMNKFRYLKVSLSLVLVLVGVKMLTVHWLKEWLGEHFNLYLLGLVLAILTAGVVASLIVAEREKKDPSYP